MQTINRVTVLQNKKIVEVAWDDGSLHRFYVQWLRDNCPCQQCRHPTGQKLTNIGDFSADISVQSATNNNAHIDVCFAPDGHLATFDATWLSNFSAEQTLPAITVWDTTTLTPSDVTRTYTDVIANNTALAEWLGLVTRYGCGILQATPTKTETVCTIAELFGHVRETNYGRYFDVQSVVNPNNLAYTGLGLSVHTDNPYRDPPPSLQLLHCLQNSADGGDSILVDGFMAAKVLADENIEHWQMLSRHTVPFRFSDTHADLRSRLPILDVNAEGNLIAVNYNNRSIRTIDIANDIHPTYYEAYRHFSEILQRPELNMQFKMGGGDLFIVDNRRVLHGRTGFSGNGGRHLQGCYADRDALHSKYRLLSGG